MKRVFIMCTAAMMIAGTYSPAQAITVNEPGYYNKCMAAYVNDPATYDRDCDESMDSLTKAPIEPKPVVIPAPEPCPFGAIDPLLFPFGARVQVAGCLPGCCN